MPVKPAYPYLARRSAIAAALGLAAAAAVSKFSLAQDDESGMPDAADALNKVMPQAAPDLGFSNAHGKRLGLADFAGHVLLVNLWATWCGPCVDEIPSLAALAPKLRRIGGLVLPISIDISGAEVVRPFYARTGITTLPILLDPSGHDMQVLNTDGVPVTIVINAAGQLVARVDGAANWDTPGVLEYLRGLGGPAAAPGLGGFVPV